VETTDPGFDMEILDAMYNTICMVLPHRPYLLLSREFKILGPHAIPGRCRPLGSEACFEGSEIRSFLGLVAHQALAGAEQDDVGGGSAEVPVCHGWKR
jgi:hypothetical protein